MVMTRHLDKSNFEVNMKDPYEPMRAISFKPPQGHWKYAVEL